MILINLAIDNQILPSWRSQDVIRTQQKSETMITLGCHRFSRPVQSNIFLNYNNYFNEVTAYSKFIIFIDKIMNF